MLSTFGEASMGSMGPEQAMSFHSFHVLNNTTSPFIYAMAKSWDKSRKHISVLNILVHQILPAYSRWFSIWLVGMMDGGTFQFQLTALSGQLSFHFLSLDARVGDEEPQHENHPFWKLQLGCLSRASRRPSVLGT